MFWKKILHQQLGQSLVELLLAVALLAVFLPILIVGLTTSREGRAQEKQRIQATALVREAREAVRNIRDRGWSLLPANGTYYPAISANAWSLQSGSQQVAGFTRSVIIADTQRNNVGAIVASGGTVDPSTKKITYRVSWTTPVAYTVEFTDYLHRYRNNTEWTQTTKPDFAAGTTISAVITQINGGEVQLAAGGGADWCAPELTIASLDLPKNGVANAISAIEGRVFAGTGENASGISYANVTISNAVPPVAAQTGSFDGYKTNGIFGETNYAYLATDNNSKEVVIINLASQDPVTGKYSESGYFNAPVSGNAEAVTVSGNIGYTVVGSTLYTFDLSSKTGSRTQLGSVSLAGTGTEIVVSGSYAYVTNLSTTQQLQIIQVSNNGATLSVVGTAALNGQGAEDIVINSTATRAYIVTGVSATKKEFFIVDTSSKTGSRSTVGSYEANGMSPKGVTVVTGNKAIIVGSSAEEYQALDISNETSPARCGGLNIDTGVNGVASILEQDGDAYSYIITGDSTTELKIIEGGPGGDYSTTGSFESSTLSMSSATAFNSFIAHIDQPVAATIRMQVAVNSPLNGSCTGVNFSFVGPTGDTADYFTPNGSSISGQIPFGTYSSGYQNPNQCFRYKVFMDTTDQFQSPVFYDMTVNYSP